MEIKTQIASRNDFTKLIDELGLKIGVELGVNEGNYSDYLLTNSKLDKLYSVDSWCEDTTKTMAATFKAWTLKPGQTIPEREQKSRELLGKHGDRSVVVKDLSFDAANKFSDGSIDFIFFDAGHRFSGFALDLINWWPKIRVGGVIAGHDYWHRYRYEVMDVANPFLWEHRLLMHLTWDDLNHKGHGYASPSFWAVKEELSKKEFFAALPKTLEQLKEAKAKLAAKGIKVVLPYQYLDAEEEGEE